MLYLKKRSSNKNGSVLLAVVIASMVLLCLATVSLHVVNYTAKATSRNVQRTQAKVTAEAALQEFVNAYQVGWSNNHPGEDAKKTWNELVAVASAHTEASPLVYKVQVGNGPSDTFTDEFDRNFGETELHLYKTGSGMAKVEAVTTFGRETQTASISFGTKTSTKSIPSNTYESKKGNATGSNQLSMGVEGTIYIENENNGVSFKRVSRATYKAHINIENNVFWDDQTYITDVTNKSVQNIYKKENRYFQQAPAVMIEGYSAVDNNLYMGTAVGKSDMNGINSSYHGSEGTFDPNNLGGYDGYFAVYKKIVAWNRGNWRIGYDNTGNTATPVIDVFCHGYYDGNLCASGGTANNMPAEIEGYHLRNECTNILAAYSGAVGSSGGNPINNAEKRDHKFMVNGDMHIYRGSASDPDDESENGALVIACDDAQSACASALTVTGDLYIEGDIILISNNGNYASNLINVSGTIHTAAGTRVIYVKNNGTDVEIRNATELTGNNFEGITCSGHDEVIPNAAFGRHFMPRKAYMALTGHQTMEDSHVYLHRSYEGASSNDIFTASIAGAINNATYNATLQPADVTAALNIGAKYADAMTHTLDGRNDGLSTYKDSTGAVKQVSQPYATLSDGSKVIQINASCRLTYEQAQYKYNNKQNIYVINLKDADIVIALPFGDFGATFKVVNKNPADHHYVYFMWYDDGGRGSVTDETRAQHREQCWYINNGSLGPSYTAHGLPAGGTSIDIPGTQTDADGNPIVYSAVALNLQAGNVLTSATSDAIVNCVDNDGNPISPGTPENPGCRIYQQINFGTGSNGSHDRWITSDYLLTLPDTNVLTATTVSDPDISKASVLASIEYSTPDAAAPARSLIDNCIMFLVPDYVSVTYNPAGGRNGLKVQGVLYAWNSEFNIVISSGTVWYGQLKVDRLNFMADASGVQWLRDLPMGEGSLMAYASRNSTGGSADTNSTILFFDY